MGAVYDLFGNGRTAIKGSANKYVASISGALAFPGSPALRISDQAARAWTDGLSGATALPADDPRRGNFAVDCDVRNPAANGECGASSNGGPSVQQTLSVGTQSHHCEPRHLQRVELRYVLRQSNAFGNWQTPFSLISARFAKIGVQADF
jgi:hypothetical protein